MQSLKCLNERGENIQLGVAADLTKVSFEFQAVVDSLKEYNGLTKFIVRRYRLKRLFL
jgi:hypothetical protein